MTKKPRIAIVIGPTRPGRYADKAARWMLKQAQARDDMEAELLDLLDHPMPFFDEKGPLISAPSENPAALRWQAALARYDGFIFVVAEYNHSVTSVLKNALDQAYEEWGGKLERWFGTLKGRIRTLPGTIIDPKRAVALDYDPVAEACLTLPQLERIINRFVAEYNMTPQKALDGRSPAQVWEGYARKRALPIIHDLARLRRILGRTDTALLTRNGIERFRLRWRDADKCRLLLSNMAGTERARHRPSGDLAIEVKIRWSPGNLDTIQVLDEIDGEWVELPSTSPLYVGPQR